MGACTFFTRAMGATPEKAFRAAVDEAAWDHGHGGYTGTIAEKNSFTLIKVLDGEDPRRYARDLVDNDDPRVEDKWGPAGCIELSPGSYYFFGWASS